MAHRLTWFPAALNELDEIAEYIAQSSPQNARMVVREIFAATDLLVDFPRLGRTVPEWDDPRYRELIVFKFRVIYEMEAERVNVLRVIHGAREMKQSL